MHRFIATVKFFRKLLFLYFFFRFCDRRNEIMGGNFALAHACITHAQTRIEIWFYVSHVNVKKMCFSEFGASGSHRTEWNVVMMFTKNSNGLRSDWYFSCWRRVCSVHHRWAWLHAFTDHPYRMSCHDEALEATEERTKMKKNTLEPNFYVFHRIVVICIRTTVAKIWLKLFMCRERESLLFSRRFAVSALILADTFNCEYSMWVPAPRVQWLFRHGDRVISGWRMSFGYQLPSLSTYLVVVPNNVCRKWWKIRVDDSVFTAFTKHSTLWRANADRSLKIDRIRSAKSSTSMRPISNYIIMIIIIYYLWFQCSPTSGDSRMRNSRRSDWRQFAFAFSSTHEKIARAQWKWMNGICSE